MSKIATYADLEEGQDVPVLAATIDRLMMIKYCGASDDFSAVHWDHPFMTGQGFPDVVVQGWLTCAHMCQAVTNWIPPEVADILKFAVRYRKPGFPGPLICGGHVVRKYVDQGQKRADLELWAKDAKGDITTAATLTLAIC